MSVTPSLEASALSGLGAALNNLLFLSQTPLMMKMVRDGSSEGYSFLPSLALQTVFSFWSAYTIYILPTIPLYVGNFPGFIIPFFNLCLFAIYAGSARRRALIVSLTALSLGFAWGVSCGLFAGGVANATGILSGLTTAATLCFFLSPLQALLTALRTLDTQRVPLLLSCVQAVQCIVWVAAGVLLFDNFITGLNCVGLCFAVGQIAAYFYVRARIKERDAAAAVVAIGVIDSPADTAADADAALPSKAAVVTVVVAGAAAALTADTTPPPDAALRAAAATPAAAAPPAPAPPAAAPSAAAPAAGKEEIPAALAASARAPAAPPGIDGKAAV